MEKINLEQLEQAFNRFLEMYTIYEEDKQEEVMLDAVKESLAQRFEYCVEVFWKVLRRYMEQTEGVIIEKPSPKTVIRQAGALELLDAEKWINYIDKRQLTAHDYDLQKLNELLSVVGDFADDGQKLLKKMKDNIDC